MSEITLVLADDHAVVRSGLRMLLDAQSDMRIVGEANNGREALELVRSLEAGCHIDGHYDAGNEWH